MSSNVRHRAIVSVFSTFNCLGRDYSAGQVGVSRRCRIIVLRIPWPASDVLTPFSIDRTTFLPRSPCGPQKKSHLVLRWGMKRPRPDESILMVNLTGTNGYVPCHHLTRTLIDGWKLPLHRQLPDAGLSRVRLISRTQGSLF